jgi:hypothetical protein
MCPNADNKSGIYIFTRRENGVGSFNVWLDMNLQENLEESVVH